MRLSENSTNRTSYYAFGQLNTAQSKITQITKKQFNALAQQIASLNSNRTENPTIFAQKTLATGEYKHQANDYYLVEQHNGESVIFSVASSNFRVPFLSFLCPILRADIKTDIISLVQDIHFTSNSNLEQAIGLLVSNLTDKSSRLTNSSGQPPKEPSIAFSFSANCPQLAIALENIKGLCLHFSQSPSTNTECSSLSDFVFSFILNPNGFNQDLCNEFSVVSIFSGLKLERQFDYDVTKLEHFYSLELERSKKIWAHPDTPAYLGKTREALNIISPDHRHLEVGSGFFPDYLLLQKQLAPNGSITIFEREKQILDRLRSEHEMSPGYSNLRFMPAIDILKPNTLDNTAHSIQLGL